MTDRDAQTSESHNRPPQAGPQGHVIEAVVSNTNGHKYVIASVYKRLGRVDEKSAILEKWVNPVWKIAADSGASDR